MTTLLVVTLVPPENRVTDPRTTSNSDAWLRPSNQQWAAVMRLVLLTREAPQTPLPPGSVAKRPACKKIGDGIQLKNTYLLHCSQYNVSQKLFRVREQDYKRPKNGYITVSIVASGMTFLKIELSVRQIRC